MCLKDKVRKTPGPWPQDEELLPELEDTELC
jgi:hypothetical protein